MKKSKHTPGPWKAFGTHVGFDTGVLVANAIEMKQSNLIKQGHMYEEAKANARLISAAPELLEAVATIYCLANLQTLLETKYSKALCNDIMKQLQVALDKARGE